MFIVSAIADSGSCAETAIADFLQGRRQGGQYQSFGVESPHSVRLLMRSDFEQEFGAIIANWVARSSAGVHVPSTDYVGPKWM